MNLCLDEFEILLPNQYWFRRNRSIGNTNFQLVLKAVDGMDENGYSIGIYLALRKAFDMVSYDLLPR